jgi:chromosome segregation ATPase
MDHDADDATIFPELDFATPHRQRDSDFYTRRDKISEHGLADQHNSARTRRYFEAWTDPAQELHSTLSTQSESKTQEAEALQASVELAQNQKTAAHATITRGSGELATLRSTVDQQRTVIDPQKVQLEAALSLVEKLQRTINAKDTEIMNLKYGVE